MTADELNRMADSFFDQIEKAEIQQEKELQDYEKTMACIEILRRSFLGLDEIRKWILDAIDIEPDRKRARLLIRMAAKIDDIQLDLEELL